MLVPMPTRLVRSCVITASLVACAACDREDRRLNQPPPNPPVAFVSQSVLQPGPTLVTETPKGPFDDNAYGTAAGQQLFSQMNCTGCHANGGGGMGPPLMDDEWIYGSEPDQVFASIANGRPNGMPAWKYKLSTQQIWELVSYVRSLSSLVPKGARNGRDDHMMVKPPESSTPKTKPKMASTPPGDD